MSIISKATVSIVAFFIGLPTLYAGSSATPPDSVGQCSRLLAKASFQKEKMKEWLDEIHKGHADLPPYPAIKMNEYGELWDMHFPVHSFSRRELLKYRLNYRDGLIYLGESSRPLSTGSFWQRFVLRPVGNLFSDKLWIYNMTCDGTLYVIPSGLDVKHSSVSHKLCIAAAGLIEIREGKLTYIDNDSGHYHPKPFTVAQVLFQLQSEGVDVSQTHFDLIGMDE